MDPLITSAELVGILRISRRTFDSMYLRGEMPACVRIGHQRFWRREDVATWINLRIEPKGEVELEPGG